MSRVKIIFDESAPEVISHILEPRSGWVMSHINMNCCSYKFRVSRERGEGVVVRREGRAAGAWELRETLRSICPGASSLGGRRELTSFM